MNKTSLLTVRNIHKSFGNLKALNGVDMEVEPNSITGLIGPNGSGKSTLFNVITGFYEKDEGQGEILFRGDRIDEMRPARIADKGVQRTFQITQATRKMTVMENMLLASRHQPGEKLFHSLIRPQAVKDREKEQLNKAREILEAVQLRELSDEYAGNLSGGQKKLLALGRLLMADPKLMMLDEPTAGVNPTLTNSLLEIIQDLREETGKTYFLIEHSMKVISSLCDYVYVLDFGENLAAGNPEEVRQNEKVLNAYLTGQSS